jgi:hypothetical protein
MAPKKKSGKGKGKGKGDEEEEKNAELGKILNNEIKTTQQRIGRETESWRSVGGGEGQ